MVVVVVGRTDEVDRESKGHTTPRRKLSVLGRGSTRCDQYDADPAQCGLSLAVESVEGSRW